jgi:hypothetical protein
MGESYQDEPIIRISEAKDSPNKDEMGRECTTDGVKKIEYRILVGKPEGKRQIGRTRRRWVGNIKIKLR